MFAHQAERESSSLVDRLGHVKDREGRAHHDYQCSLETPRLEKSIRSSPSNLPCIQGLDPCTKYRAAHTLRRPLG